MKIAVKTLENKESGQMDISDAVFGVAPRADILQRVVRWQLARRQAGTHKTKEIGDVNGTTKKPFKQKGTGNARQGSLRSPQMRGGATIFGPVVRSHEFKLQKKVRQLGLRMALSSKQAGGQLIILDEAKLATLKTKDLVKNLSKLGVQSGLIITGERADDVFMKAASNVPLLDVLPVEGVNVYDILRRETLILTKDAVAKIETRLAQKPKKEKVAKAAKEKAPAKKKPAAKAKKTTTEAKGDK